MTLLTPPPTLIAMIRGDTGPDSTAGCDSTTQMNPDPGPETGLINAGQQPAPESGNNTDWSRYLLVAETVDYFKPGPKLEEPPPSSGDWEPDPRRWEPDPGDIFPGDDEGDDGSGFDPPNPVTPLPVPGEDPKWWENLPTIAFLDPVSMEPAECLGELLPLQEGKPGESPNDINEKRKYLKGNNPYPTGKDASDDPLVRLDEELMHGLWPTLVDIGYFDDSSSLLNAKRKANFALRVAKGDIAPFFGGWENMTRDQMFLAVIFAALNQLRTEKGLGSWSGKEMADMIKEVLNGGIRVIPIGGGMNIVIWKDKNGVIHVEDKTDEELRKSKIAKLIKFKKKG